MYSMEFQSAHDIRRVIALKLRYLFEQFFFIGDIGDCSQKIILTDAVNYVDHRDLFYENQKPKQKFYGCKTKRKINVFYIFFTLENLNLWNSQN